MKRHSRRSDFSPRTARPDIAGLINKLQQQLFSLEKKIDALISRPQERPSEARPAPKPFGPFGHSYRNDNRGHGRDFRERNLFQAVCADCGKACEIPFKPSTDRPVYCRECFSRRKQDSGVFRANSSDMPPKERNFTQEVSFEKRDPNQDRQPRQKRNHSGPRRHKKRG